MPLWCSQLRPQVLGNGAAPIFQVCTVKSCDITSVENPTSIKLVHATFSSCHCADWTISGCLRLQLFLCPANLRAVALDPTANAKAAARATAARLPIGHVSGQKRQCSGSQSHEDILKKERKGWEMVRVSRQLHLQWNWSWLTSVLSLFAEESHIPAECDDLLKIGMWYACLCGYKTWTLNLCGNLLTSMRRWNQVSWIRQIKIEGVDLRICDAKQC